MASFQSSRTGYNPHCKRSITFLGDKMNWKRFIPVGIFCLLCLCKTGVSEPFTLDSLKLQQYCKLAGSDNAKLSEEEYVHKAICIFYVSGIVDGYRLGDSKLKICTPDNVTLGELALIVSKYLNEYPEKLHNPPEYLVVDAIYTAFPCKPEPPHK
jgi:Rap1a immunity proteins